MFLLTVMMIVLLGRINSQEVCPNIITKKLWGGRSPTETDYLVVPARYVIISHTATPECRTEEACVDIIARIQNLHMTRFGWPDIAFSFLVGGDGNVYEGTGWHKLGTHTENYSKFGVGITLIGNFVAKSPPRQQLEVTKRLVDCGLANNDLAKNYKLMAQRQLVAGTISPGLKVFQTIQSWPHWSQNPFIKDKPTEPPFKFFLHI